MDSPNEDIERRESESSADEDNEQLTFSKRHPILMRVWIIVVAFILISLAISVVVLMVLYLTEVQHPTQRQEGSRKRDKQKPETSDQKRPPPFQNKGPPPIQNQKLPPPQQGGNSERGSSGSFGQDPWPGTMANIPHESQEESRERVPRPKPTKPPRGRKPGGFNIKDRHFTTNKDASFITTDGPSEEETEHTPLQNILLFLLLTLFGGGVFLVLCTVLLIRGIFHKLADRKERRRLFSCLPCCASGSSASSRTSESDRNVQVLELQEGPPGWQQHSPPPYSIALAMPKRTRDTSVDTGQCPGGAPSLAGLPTYNEAMQQTSTALPV